MSGWSYYEACSAILALAQLVEPARAINTCRCDALFLTPPGMPHADECAGCFRRARRETDEAADRHIYLRWKRGEVPDLVVAEPVGGERVLVAPAQGSLF